MAWKTSLSSNSRIVEVSCTGHISSNDLTIFAIETAFLIKQHGSTRVLIDLSKAHAGFSAGETQELLDIYVEYHVPKITRSAIVLPDGKIRKELSELLPVLKEYGYEVALFGVDREALEWLKD